MRKAKDCLEMGLTIFKRRAIVLTDIKGAKK